MTPTPVEQRAPEPGGSIRGEKYTPSRVIGAGGVAVVHLATHRNGNRGALEVLHRALSIDPLLAARSPVRGAAADRRSPRTAIVAVAMIAAATIATMATMRSRPEPVAGAPTASARGAAVGCTTSAISCRGPEESQRFAARAPALQHPSRTRSAAPRLANASRWSS